MRFSSPKPAAVRLALSKEKPRSHSTPSTGELDSTLVTLPSMSEEPSGSVARVSGDTSILAGVITLATEPSFMMPLMVILSPQGGAISIGVLGVTVVGSRRGDAYEVNVVPEGVQMTMTSALCDKAPLVPLILNVQLPGCVPAATVKVTVCLPSPVADEGVTLPAV